MSEVNPDAAILPLQNPWAVLNKLSIAEWLRAHGKFVRPELTKKQRLELKECFELIDADGSGAISSSEMLTAFHVLGIRAKRSEVEELLASVDSDGSGEVEYPEFVQIMTTKMDSQTQEEEPRAASAKPGKAQPLPFPLLAQAYRRKKLMEAVMQGDKATQERLQARAEEMEQERIAAIAEHDAQKRQVKKRPTTLSQITKERIRKAAKLNRKEVDLPLPGYILAKIDEDVKNVLFGVHERALLRRMSMSQTEKENLEKPKKEKGRHPSSQDKTETRIPNPSDLPSATEVFDIVDAVAPDPSKPKPTSAASDAVEAKSGPDTPRAEAAHEKESKRFTISNLDGGQADLLSNQFQVSYKQELSEMRAVRSKLRDKPTLEQQRIKLQAVQSVGSYYQRDENDNNLDPRTRSPVLKVNEAERERIETPWRIPSPTKRKERRRNTSHARIVYVPPPKPVKPLKEIHKKPEWISHLNSKRQDNG